VAFPDRPTDYVLAVSIYLTARSAKDIFPLIASTEHRATSARYRIIFTRHHRVYFTDFTNFIIISTITRYLVCVLQNCQKRHTKRYTALNNVVSETHLPVTQFDTSFETLINTRQHTIEDIVRDAIQQHGYNNAFVLP